MPCGLGIRSGRPYTHRLFYALISVIAVRHRKSRFAFGVIDGCSVDPQFFEEDLVSLLRISQQFGIRNNLNECLVVLVKEHVALVVW